MIFFFLFFMVASAQLDGNLTQKWMVMIEEVLTMVTLGPLKDEITPAYLGRRTLSDVISVQAARFRSRVARSLIECSGNKATSCIDPSTTSDEAVQVVHDELQKHNFTVSWIKSSPLCPTYGKIGGSALAIDLPFPKSEE